MNEELKNAKPTGFFSFRNGEFLIVEADGIEYIAAKPLVASIGMQWASARDTLFKGDNPILFGSTRLLIPEVAGLGTLKGPQNTVCIALKQVYLYLARINTARIRANGNENAADELLTLQKEWAEVLHRYENGETVSKSELADERSLVTLINAQKNCDPAQKEQLQRIITRKLLQMNGESEQPIAETV